MQPGLDTVAGQHFKFPFIFVAKFFLFSFKTSCIHKACSRHVCEDLTTTPENSDGVTRDRKEARAWRLKATCNMGVFLYMVRLSKSRLMFIKIKLLEMSQESNFG